MWLKHLILSCLFLATLVQSKEINGITYEVEYARGGVVEYTTYTKIPTLTKDLLEGVIYPTYLYFNETGLEKIEPGALQTIPKLTELHIRGCNMKKIESGIFNNLNVSLLAVAKCQIEEIAADAFDNMKNVKWLDVRENPLKVVNPAWYTDKPLLTTIVLSHNQIEEIPAHLFAAGPEGDIIAIHFHDNKVKTINSDAFVDIQRRFVLYLGENELETFPNLNLAPGNCIRNIFIEHNKISCKNAEDLQSVSKAICKNEKGFIDLKGNLAEPTCIAELQEWAQQHELSLWI